MDEQPDSQQWQRKRRDNDPRSNAELLQVALSEVSNADEEGENLYWHAISALHLRGERDTYEVASTLCTSESPNERCVAADILGQLGAPNKIFHEEAVVLLLSMLKQEQEPVVLSSIGVALGHLNDPRAIQPLTQLKGHSDPDVRHGVVFGLLGHRDEQAIQTLIELSTDKIALVRDWATFGLGTQIETDIPEIRAALMARITDEDSDTRGEAMVGLARRHDLRIVEPLLAELKLMDSAEYLALEAAAEIGDARLYPVLIKLRAKWGGEQNWRYNTLEEAIEKCQP